MAITFKKGPAPTVSTTRVVMFVAEDGSLCVQDRNGTRKVLDTSGVPIPLQDFDTPTPPNGWVKVHGKDFGGGTVDVAVTTATGTTRLTRRDALNVPPGGFYSASQKVRQSWSVGPLGTDTQATGITLSPPAGQWVLYPCRFEAVSTTQDSTTTSALFTTQMDILFDDSGGTPDTRLQTSIFVIPSGIIATSGTLAGTGLQPTVDSLGEISTNVGNFNATDTCWLESVFTVGPAQILPGAP